MSNQDTNKIEVYLDEQTEPLAVYRPPVRFSLDTNTLADGKHKLTIKAFSASNKKSVRIINFTVRNGPGIAVDGLKDNDVLEGKVSILINAFGGSDDEMWEPERAETPSPIPTWAWVLFILVVTWGIYYSLEQFKPTEEFANTPTYATWGLTEDITSTSSFSDPNLGARLYRTSCASCHQENGQGIAGVFPPLAGDPVVIAEDATRHIEIVLYGAQGSTLKGVKYVAQMPSWAEQLSDEEVAAVINHERVSWGNSSPQIIPQDVAIIRGKKIEQKK
ncbi:MAG: c-type cytochrome [Candidatus Dadabacteria bacterium]|nr:c-type cytochrome [Candidatus Dadabacteria bacterium]